MPITNGFNLFDPKLLVVFSKIAVLVILGLYVIFALIIVRQVTLMKKTLVTTVSTLVKDLAVYHVIFAIILTFLVWKFL